MTNIIQMSGANRFKLVKTRSVLYVVSIAFVIVSMSGLLQAAIVAVGQNTDAAMPSEDLVGELDTLTTTGASFGAFFMVLATSFWVARDFNSGAYQLSHVLAGSTAREVQSRVVAGGSIALILGLVGAVISQLLGTAVLLAMTDISYQWSAAQLLIVPRTGLVFACSALIGLGIGYLARSTAASVFIVLTMFIIAPMALVTGAVLGHEWMNTANDALPIGVIERALDSAMSVSAVGMLGIIAWAAAALVAGFLVTRRSF